MADDRCRLVKPIEGGRQSHYCILPKGHEEQQHRCPCSHEWVGDAEHLDPAVELTAEQWRDRFLALSPEQQVQRAGNVLDWAQRSARCFIADHDGAVERVRQRELQLFQQEGP